MTEPEATPQHDDVYGDEPIMSDSPPTYAEQFNKADWGDHWDELAAGSGNIEKAEEAPAEPPAEPTEPPA